MSRNVCRHEIEKSVSVRIGWNAAKGPAIVDQCLEVVFDILSRVERLEKVNQAEIVQGGVTVTKSR
jgi:hypothetical protein